MTDGRTDRPFYRGASSHLKSVLALVTDASKGAPKKKFQWRAFVHLAQYIDLSRKGIHRRRTKVVKTMREKTLSYFVDLFEKSKHEMVMCGKFDTQLCSAAVQYAACRSAQRM